MQKNAEVKETFLRILDALGTEVKDIRIKMEKTRLNEKDLPSDMPDTLKAFMVKIYSLVKKCRGQRK